MRFLMAMLGWASLATATAAPLPSGGAPTVEPGRRPDAVVVVYREVLGEIGGADRGPTLTVYGDGRMVAHYPLYMKRAGDYERRLAPHELDALLRSLADKGVLDFDAVSVRAAKQVSATRARAAGRPLFEASDAATTVIEVAVERYVRAAGAPEVRDLQKQIAWTNLRGDAERHADVAPLVDLAAAEQELRALREHPGFTRIR